MHIVTTIKSEKTKVSGANCPKNLINVKEPEYLEFVRLLFESLKLFFARNFKKIAASDIDHVYNCIDLKRIENLIKPPDDYPSKVVRSKPFDSFITHSK